MWIKWRGLDLPSRVTADRATLTDIYGKFNIEPFERGFGMTIGNNLRGVLLSSSAVIDSSFSPVVRVKYEIEETRVGQKTSYDRLVLEIWTNGAITPQMALVESAKILGKHLNPFVQYTDPGEEMPIDFTIEIERDSTRDSFDQELKRRLNKSLAELGLI